jgi:putative ABC transport system substrate-binding protein
MRRREFIAGLAGTAAWPMVAQSQGERLRRAGVASGFTEADEVGQAYVSALKEGLAKLGWLEGRNLRIDVRWGGGSPALIRSYATELVNLAPDVIVTVGGTMTRAVKKSRVCRRRLRHAGIKLKPKGRPLPASGWKHRMDGGWERRP